MSCRVFIGVIVVIVLIAPASAAAQSAPAQSYSDADLAKWPPPPSAFTAPRTPWGDPDIQGTYDFLSRIPFERPDGQGKAVLTEQEWEEWLNANPPNMQGYNDFWNNRNFVRDRRTALVVDPPNGRIPPRTPQAEKKLDAFDAALFDEGNRILKIVVSVLRAVRSKNSSRQHRLAVNGFHNSHLVGANLKQRHLSNYSLKRILDQV